jgi:hypothetical protein
MPIYIYEHPDTGETKEIVQRMMEKHEYFEDGKEWKRVFESPQASTGTIIGNLDPTDKKKFIEKTGQIRNITQGDLWDISAGLSEKRAKTFGKDPVKEKAFKDYKKKTHGSSHPNDN